MDYPEKQSLNRIKGPTIRFCQRYSFESQPLDSDTYFAYQVVLLSVARASGCFSYNLRPYFLVCITQRADGFTTRLNSIQRFFFSRMYTICSPRRRFLF